MKKVFPFLLATLSSLFVFGCSTQPAQKISAQRTVSRTEDSSSLSAKAKEFFVQGSVFEMQQRYAEAIVEFQQALRYDSSAIILHALAKNYFALSQFSELSKIDIALDYAVAATKADSGFAEGWALLAEIYVKKFRYDDAIKAMERLVDIDSDISNLYNLARLYELANPDKAIFTYERALKIEDDPTILLRLADLYQQKERLDDYNRTLEKLFAITPENPSLSELLLNSYINSKEYSKAEKFLDDQSIDKDEQKRLMYLYGSQLLSKSDSAGKDASRRLLEKISIFNPKSWELFLMAASLSEKISDTVAAENFLSKALEINDTNSAIAVQAAAFYLQNKKYSTALNIIEKSKRKFPEEDRLFFIEGIVLSAMERHEDAVISLRKALDIAPNGIDIWLQLAITFDQMKEKNSSFLDSSDAAYERVLTLDPDNALANNNYAYSLSLRKKNLQRAKQMAETALLFSPNNSSYIDTYGWVLFQLGEYDKALEQLLRAVAEGGASSTEFDHLADVYYQLGQNENAKKYWNEALKISPEKKEILEKLKSVR